MTDQRSLLRAIFDAAVAAAHPGIVLAAHLRPVPKGRVICLAAGKGAAAMAAATERHYLDALELDPDLLTGIATTRHGHGVPTRRIRVVEAGHPVPDEAGLKAADDTLRLAAEATADDLLLVLLSGGGSANWIAPADGVSFTQNQQVNRALLRSGAPIGEMNIVRKHLSRIKGGRLARAGQRAAEIVTLAISDVPHGDPFTRRTHGDRARQWSWRPEPGIYAGAGGPAEGHVRHCGAGRRHRRRRRRRRQRDRSGRRRDRSGDVCEDEVARPRSCGLSRQQRCHRVL